MDKKILIIEDDEGVLEALTLFLEAMGYTVEGLKNSQKMQRTITTFKPQLILLDMLLSGEDGRKICQTLKHNKETKDIPILMTSAHPAAEESVKQFGSDDFIPKPFDTSVLLEKIRALG